jgi:hypothetical protein
MTMELPEPPALFEGFRQRRTRGQRARARARRREGARVVVRARLAQLRRKLSKG